MWLLFAGPAADCSLLFGDPRSLPAVSNPALLSMIPGPTDRAPLPMPVASLDVYSLYHLQLSYRHAIPARTRTTPHNIYIYYNIIYTC